MNKDALLLTVTAAMLASAGAPEPPRHWPRPKPPNERKKRRRAKRSAAKKQRALVGVAEEALAGDAIGPKRRRRYRRLLARGGQ